MITNLTIVLENRPGALAAACEAVGAAGVTIEGLCCFASQGIAILYMAVADAAGARRAVESSGLKVSEEREMVLVSVDDRPGGTAQVLRQIGDAGINIDLAYQAGGSRLAIGADDPQKVRAVAQL